jgi:hypothetical protein
VETLISKRERVKPGALPREAFSFRSWQFSLNQARINVDVSGLVHPEPKYVWNQDRGKNDKKSRKKHLIFLFYLF